MEYNHPYLIILGIIGLFIWSLDFWNIFKKPQLHFPSDEGLPKGRMFIKLFVYLLGLVSWGLLTYGMTEPRQPQGYTEREIDINDIFLVVDVSQSMQANDFTPNRLEAAKLKINEFVDMMPTDRIGVVIFSEKVFTLLPLTTDLTLIKKVIQEISIGPLGSGTNIGDAVGLASARLVNSEAKNKVIVLLTDGVSNGGNMTPLQAAQQAKEYGMKIYSIGMGGKGNAKLPVNGVFGQRFRSIPGGSFDFKTLREMADLTGGEAYQAADVNALKNVFVQISELEKSKVKVGGEVVYKELFYRFIFLGIIGLFLSEIMRRLLMKEVL